MIPINKQAPEKREDHPHGYLRVHSMFATIQGEGPYVGVPSIFVRLSGCNLQCPGCDTEYADGVYESPDSIVTRIGMLRASSNMRTVGDPLVVITGGEPFRQNISELIDLLYMEGYRIQVESNGTLGFEPTRIYMQNRFSIVVSPKAGKVERTLWPYIIAYKYVLNHGNIDPKDGLPTSVLGMPAKPARPHDGFSGRIYVQPADEPEKEGDSKNKVNLVLAIDSAMRFGYTLCIQTHKIIGLE